MDDFQFRFCLRCVLPALLRFCVVVIAWSGCEIGLAQSELLQPLPTPSAKQADDASAGQSLVGPGISFGMTVPSDWEFGLQINSSASARKVSATFPVPIDWPEQEVELLGEFKSDNVTKFERVKPGKWTQQFGFSIKKMAPESSEKAYVRFRVKKKMIQAPRDTIAFVKAKKVPGKYKEFLRPSPLIESKNKRIIAIAGGLEDDSLSAWKQVEKNYQWVRENITYKFDKVNRSCLEALDNKHGDCGELTSLFIAICRAQGVPARSVWIPGHVYPEFYLQDQDGIGHWFPCQAAGSYAFGSMAEIRPILQKGDRFKMPSEKEEVRYVRPTVEAFGAPVSIQWIRQQVTEQK